MTTRKELTEAVGARYRAATATEKGTILDEFVALTGYHRKHATRVLGKAPNVEGEAPIRDWLYDKAVRQALIVLWEAGDRICGKRLKPLIPVLIAAMERHGHLALDAHVKTRLLEISAATIDRSLSDARAQIDGKLRRRTGVGATIRRSIPVRTFADWRDPPPGFFEVDMVEHCGRPKTDGDFVHTLVLTDIASGWTECVAMPVFASLDPVRLLRDIRVAKQKPSNMAAHGPRAPAFETPELPEVSAYVQNLGIAWKAGEVRPTHQPKATKTRWWRTKADPFEHAWPVVEGWLIAEPTATAKDLMTRLAEMLPDAYASKAQLRTLQRRVKAWRAEKAKDLILGKLRKASAAKTEV